MKIIAALLALCLCSNAFGADIVSTASGLWSAGGTWVGGVPPGDGDTASIGAHTVIIAANTTVGTSPNNNTTNVIFLTSASSILVISNSATLTVKGNIGHVNGSTHRQLTGTTLTFDNSASGGSPVYRFQNGGFSSFYFNGAILEAISGQTIALTAPLGAFAVTNSTIRRVSNWSPGGNIVGNVVLKGNTFDACTRFIPTSVSATIDFIVDGNTFTNGTHASDDVTLTMTTAATAGTRRISANKFYKIFTYTAKSFHIQTNYFGAGLAAVVGSTFGSFRLNLFKHNGLLNGGNGALFPDSCERNYFVVHGTSGNPHFVSPTALLGADNVVSQNICEGHVPDATDIGDAFIVNSGATSGANKISGRNNIVIPMAYTNMVTSGTTLTVYNSNGTNEWYRNTGCVNDSTVSGTKNGMFTVAEASTGVAAQVPAMKSNLAWATNTGQGYFAMRASGNVKDIITASSADYNWRFNTTDGDNQRGYEDKAAANTLWTAGDAVAAGVDTHQGSGDPQFFDPYRNIGKWNLDRGYGANNFTNGLESIQADVTRIPDLINYVFEGFRPGNASCRNAAHDGGCVGAANFYKSTRTTSGVISHRLILSKFGI